MVRDIRGDDAHVSNSGICIGQQFALTEAAYVVVRLLQKFDRIELRAQGLEGVVTQDVGVASCPGNLVTLRLHEARA